MSGTPAAIVTGASRGIGRAIALQLARAGYAVTINYRRDAAAAEAAVADVQSAGGKAIAVSADVGSKQARQRLLDSTLDAFGRLDVLVNNAGITSQGRKDILDADEESWDVVFDTNLKGPFFMTQAAAVQMIEQVKTSTIPYGVIINVSSISAYATSSNRADYCMTKAALQMMTWLYADRLAEEQIRVYEVCPGVIASDMTAPVREKYDRLIQEGLSPICRWGQPEDVAKAVEMLVSSTLAFSTGDRINVDGGFHIRRL